MVFADDDKVCGFRVVHIVPDILPEQEWHNFCKMAYHISQKAKEPPEGEAV